VSAITTSLRARQPPEPNPIIASRENVFLTFRSRSAVPDLDAPPRTDTLVQRFAVPFEYPVVFTRGLFEPGNPALEDAVARLEPRRRHRLLPVIDEGVARAWPGLVPAIRAYVEARPERLALAGDPVVVPGGEACKNDPSLVASLQARFQELRIDRHSFVLIVGGGAVLDMAGYAAATTHRGLRVVRVPTTVLAQDDSGVGVKNGVNAHGSKNFFGTFAPPFAVLNDSDFLLTLSARDRIEGMAEAVKIALIRDRGFFAWLEKSAGRLVAFDREEVETLVRRCAELHLRHIATSGDPFEAGSARPLDFGHWAAHRLETLSGHALRHGEAVAIGMALDARYSVEAGLLDEAALPRVLGLMEALGLPTWHGALAMADPSGRPAILRGLEEFREHLGGELHVTLLRDIGEGFEVTEMDEARILRALAWLEGRAKG
jgi:3-dehydroquinate synthase